MKLVTLPLPGRWRWLCPVCLSLTLGTSADQVDMQNGDRYVGTVLSLTNEVLIVRTEVLGTLNLPKAKVTHITFGTPAKGSPTLSREKTLPPADKPNTNAIADPAGMSAQLAASSNLIQRVQKQFLAGAAPETQDKFNELVSGLLSGKMTVDDLRAQARSTAEQVRAARKDLDESTGWAVDGYLAILDRFLSESSGSARTGTNAPPSKTRPPDLLEEP